LVHIHFLLNKEGKKHSNGAFHPESAQRIEAVESWFSTQINPNITYEYNNIEAPREDIEIIHSANYYDLIKKTQGIDQYFRFDADTSANAYTFQAASQAVEIGKIAITQSNLSKSIFALVRPPGHHATQTTPMGFCIFNNIAIATQFALNKSLYKRIAIIDFDHHFGNGTAYIHEYNPSILYISTHADPRRAYPGTGFVEEIGKGDGRGFNICIPLGIRATEIDISLAFQRVLTPILYQFKPEILAISAGFDGYERDPIGILGISLEGFGLIGQILNNIALDLNIPVAHFLEGGYNIKMFPLLISNYVQSFFNNNDSKNEKKIEKAQDQTTLTLNKAQSLLKDFWEI